ncbi:hypothetical protein [Micavibrio aeruginosavorus]|uniref:Uncharacterized protein n=1 Tax=Micavibrio aeruginosavorus (strain ARL-13) TaxID=856793 RepID=G2KM44_MICAA|nr:hypothetical protein [Micavibrio aeruginosavorus]AEP09740.1 hypothetical protein MICA_1422 [Micavibrio aeruginosavorus ARL-13]
MGYVSNAIDHFNCLSGINRLRALSAAADNDVDGFLNIAQTARRCGWVDVVLNPQMVRSVSTKIGCNALNAMFGDRSAPDVGKAFQQFASLRQVVSGTSDLEAALSSASAGIERVGSVVAASLQKTAPQR